MPDGVASGVSPSNLYKDEITQLRALLAEGGLDNGVLEGKYLNQLKRTRQLTVQLESEKTLNRQLAAQVAALEAEHRSSGGKVTGDVVKGRVRPTEAAAGEEGGDAQQNTSSALRERLDRAYLQLNESKLQLEEHKKEVQRMRKIVQQEVGGTSQELEALLKNSSESTSGWRGRAQQIVLLKSKVKELERALDVVTASAGRSNDGNSVSDGNLPHKGADVASAVTETTVAGVTTATSLAARSRDLDDVARERVVELQNRRLLQQRELVEALDKRTAELEAQKRRLEAVQARQANLETDNHTLREYLHEVMKKTENDNALIDAYREELAELRRSLHTARMKLQESEAWEAKSQSYEISQKSGEKHGRSPRRVSADALDAKTAVAVAGADAAIELNRLRLENVELRSQLARSGGGVNSSGNDAHSSKPHGPDDDTALVQHWLRSVAPSSSIAMASGAELAGACGNHTEDWQLRVAEVLRRAHGAVRLLEQQRQEADQRLSKCYDKIQQLQGGKTRSIGKEQHRGMKVDGADNEGEAEALMGVVMQENRALKLRVKTLQELMEKEIAAYESIRFASSTSLPVDGATAVAYQQLQRQYEDLRSAFNALQRENLKHKDNLRT